MSETWLADRMHHIDASGIRKVFDLAAKMTDPVNLSIGQPHFPMPRPIAEAMKQAVDAGKNAYSQTQGIAPLREAVQARVDAAYPDQDRMAFITSGTSGGLMLALMALVGPGDEVIVPDPWFVMYKHLTTAAGGTVVPVSTYPTFQVDVDAVAAAITPRTKLIVLNSPANPTGAVASEATMRALAELADDRDVAILSDEIYSIFSYDGPAASPAAFNRNVIVIDGFSKSHSMTGHRVGWCHGPRHLVEAMIKLQQFSFVCSPQPSQWGALAGVDLDLSDSVAAYRRNRDHAVAELSPLVDVHSADGAFYLFLPAPGGDGGELVARAIEKQLLIIPGGVFSDRDTHFRLSYATDAGTLDRGLEILKPLLKTA